MNVDVVRSEDDVQPYTIFNSKQIEQSGAVNVEDFLKQQLTMNTVAQTNAQLTPQAAASSTTSSINLRGLGTNETLILIDGRRSAGINVGGLTGNIGALGQPDINGIPLSAIERIEVLPSSASAIYGGAAVGGVVNIILKKDFSGGDFSYTYAKPADSSAHTSTVSASYGTSLFGGATQIMIGGAYSDGSPLVLGDRLNLVGRGISTILGNSPSYFYSATEPFEGATPNIASTPAAGVVPPGTPGATCYTPTFCIGRSQPNLILRNGTPLNSPITSIPVGAAPGVDLSSGLLANAGKYNLNLADGTGPFALQAPIGTVPMTKSLFATLRQTLFDDVMLFTEFSTSTNAGRSITDPIYGAYPVPSTAPTNPFEQNVSVAFPSTLSEPQTSDSVTQAATVGLIVPIAYNWSSEADYTWSRNSFESEQFELDSTSFYSALTAGTVDPFVDTSANPPNLAPYVGPANYSGSGTLNDVSLRMSGPLGSLPAGRPTLTVGLEHRKEGGGEATRDVTFPLTPPNNIREVLFGQSQSTDSLYAEGLVPLASARSDVFLIHSLDLQAAGRSERYTVEAKTPYEFLSPATDVASNPPSTHATVKYTSTNPTVGLKYEPVADVALRMSYSTAFLPPTASQLLPNPTPACGSSACLLIMDPRSGESYRVNYLAGGNPSLQPQKSKDWDFGLIWEPHESFLKGVRVDVEYYKITQPNYIVSNPSIQQLISNAAFGSRVSRDPTTGLVTLVDGSALNASEYKTSGWDVKVRYRKETRIGSIGLDMAGTFLKYDQRQFQIGAPFYDYAGYPNDGGETNIKSNAIVSWSLRHWAASWTATYYSSYYQEGAPGGPLALQNGVNTFFTAAQGSYSIPSQIYHDLFVSYTVDSATRGSNLAGWMLSNVTLSVGIHNVFNTRPPFDAAIEPYFYSPYGDPRLRTFIASIRKAF